MSDRVLSFVSSTDTDQSLLRDFARTADEAAFRKIVDRYAGLVRAVARRATGSADMAEETAQAVFALLARKASSVARADHLVGWLHRTTVFDALRRARSESRHRRKIAAFATAMPPLAHDQPPAWRDALAVLDESLEKLRESDRRIVIMRYLEDRSYTGIAEAIGKSEAAVKKQSTRALDKLRAIMHRRGTVYSTSGLASILTAETPSHAAMAAPHLASTALGAAPHITLKTLTLHTLHLMHAWKLTAAAAVILLCVVPIAWQEHAIAQARSDLVALEPRRSRPPELAGPRPPAPATRLTPAAASAVIDLEQVARDVESTQPGPTRRSFSEQEATRDAMTRLEEIDASSLVRFLDELPGLSGGRRRQLIVEDWLFTRLGQVDPLKAVHIASSLVRRNPELADSLAGKTSYALMALLKDDPKTAVKEFISLRESGAFEGKGAASSPEVYYGQFIGELLRIDWAEAIRLYGTLNLGGRLNALSRATMFDLPEARKFVLSEIPTLEPQWQQHLSAAVLASELKKNGLEGVGALLKEVQLPPAQSIETLAAFLSDTNRGQAQAHLTMADRLDWLRQQLPADQFAKAGGLFLGKTAEFSSEDLQESRNREFRGYDWGAHRDEAIAAMFTPPTPPDDPAAALSLALEIRNEALRMETLRRLARRFKDSPAAFKDEVDAATSLTADEKVQVFQP